MRRSTISFICASFIFTYLTLNQEVVSSEKGKSLWSLKKISSVEPPLIEEDSWSNNAIDQFILKRHQDSHIKPNPAAEKLKIITGAKQIKLALKIDPQLIGGFTIEIGSKMIDTSIRGQLKQISALLGA